MYIWPTLTKNTCLNNAFSFLLSHTRCFWFQEIFRKKYFSLVPIKIACASPCILQRLRLHEVCDRVESQCTEKPVPGNLIDDSHLDTTQLISQKVGNAKLATGKAQNDLSEGLQEILFSWHWFHVTLNLENDNWFLVRILTINCHFLFSFPPFSSLWSPLCWLLFLLWICVSYMDCNGFCFSGYSPR